MVGGAESVPHVRGESERESVSIRARTSAQGWAMNAATSCGEANHGYHQHCAQRPAQDETADIHSVTEVVNEGYRLSSRYGCCSRYLETQRPHLGGAVNSTATQIALVLPIGQITSTLSCGGNGRDNRPPSGSGPPTSNNHLDETHRGRIRSESPAAGYGLRRCMARRGR